MPPSKKRRLWSADDVARCVLECAPPKCGKVVAGIVAGSKCVSVATGGKWWPGSSLHHINDGHAEVLARRGFVAALQLDPSLASEDLHMYVSRPPCGDCAIYRKKDGSVAFTGAKLFDFRREKTQVLSATRLKAGRSDNKYRATSLSCSDKILRWSLCGLQGRLLSEQFRQPIRLTSLVVGCSEDEDEGVRESLHRLNARILSFPKQLRVEPLQLDTTRLVPPHALNDDTTNWFLGCEKFETIVNGRLQGSTVKRPKPSRLCTASLFSTLKCYCNIDEVRDLKKKTAPSSSQPHVTELLRAYEVPF